MSAEDRRVPIRKLPTGVPGSQVVRFDHQLGKVRSVPAQRSTAS